MPAHIRVGGAWTEIDTAYIRVGGAWVAADNVYVKVGGAWELAWQNVVYSLANIGDYSDTGALTQTYSVTVWFRTDGTVDIVRNIGGTTNNVETFVVPTSVATSLYVRCTEGAGGTPLNLGDASGAWWALSVDRSFGLEYTSGGGVDFITSDDLTFELATDSGGTNVVATRTGRILTVGETS